MSLIPHYYEKTVNLFIGLGPASRLINCKSEAMKNGVKQMDVIKFVFIDILKQYDFFAPGWLTETINAEFRSLFPKSFEDFVGAFDMDPYVEERGRIKSISGHLPSGAGYRSILHFGQLVNSETFKRYDFGGQYNYHKYGTTVAPDYDLHNSAKIPVALFVGDEDM